MTALLSSDFRTVLFDKDHEDEISNLTPECVQTHAVYRTNGVMADCSVTKVTHKSSVTQY